MKKQQRDRGGVAKEVKAWSGVRRGGVQGGRMLLLCGKMGIGRLWDWAVCTNLPDKNCQ